jgi:hypothetical protein
MKKMRVVMAGLGVGLALACGTVQALDVSRWGFGSASQETVQKDLQLLFPGSTLVSHGDYLVVGKANLDGGAFNVLARFGSSGNAEHMLTALTFEGDLPSDGKLSVMDGFTRMDSATEDYVKGPVEADVSRSGNHVSITFKAAPEPTPAQFHDDGGAGTLFWGLILLGFVAGALVLLAKARHIYADHRHEYHPGEVSTDGSRMPIHHDEGMRSNPANGLPMMGAFDIHGNTYGSNMNDSPTGTGSCGPSNDSFNNHL